MEGLKRLLQFSSFCVGFPVIHQRRLTSAKIAYLRHSFMIGEYVRLSISHDDLKLQMIEINFEIMNSEYQVLDSQLWIVFLV